MKNRLGFVSNSSTTSYMILVKPEKVEAVDFILRNIKGKNTPSIPVADFRAELIAEVKELEKDIIYINGTMTKLDKTADKIGLNFHNFLQKIHSLGWRKESVRIYRQHPPMFSMTLKDYQDRLNRLKEELEKDKVKCEERLKLLNGNDSWSIISFDDDANFSTLKNMVDELIEKKNAIVLVKETS